MNWGDELGKGQVAVIIIIDGLVTPNPRSDAISLLDHETPCALRSASDALNIPLVTTPRPVKVAKDLPSPPTLSPQDLQRIDAEASQWRASVGEGTATLEHLTAADLRIRLR